MLKSKTSCLALVEEVGRGEGSPAAGEHCELCATACRESFTPLGTGLQRLKAVGLQPQKIKIAHIEEHEIILWDSTSELFYRISNITCSIGV